MLSLLRPLAIFSAVLLLASSAVAGLPHYSISLGNPVSEFGRDACGFMLVMRLYDPFSLSTTPAPTVSVHFADGFTLTNITFDPFLAYNFDDPQTWTGQMSLGNDQYATYLGANLTMHTVENPSHGGVVGISAHGLVARAAYQNLKYEYTIIPAGGSCPREHLSKGFLVSTDDRNERDFDWDRESPNPYLEGNPSSVFYYAVPPAAAAAVPSAAKVAAKSSSSVARRAGAEEVSTTAVSAGLKGSVPVYRLDKTMTKISQPDGHSDSGCSSAYLFANLYLTPYEGLLKACERRDVKYTHGIVKVQIPKTFDVFDDDNVLFEDYDTRYFSVGAHLCDKAGVLPFWTVNTRLMAKYLNLSVADAAGKSFYIFFAPSETVRSVALSQFGPSLSSVPPTFSWGGFSGYLLAAPDFAFIFRYRSPSASFGGNPENSPCFDDPFKNEPVSGLGEWAPQIFGDNFRTLEEFQNAEEIGAVKANEAWPEQANPN